MEKEGTHTKRKARVSAQRIICFVKLSQEPQVFDGNMKEHRNG